MVRRCSLVLLVSLACACGPRAPGSSLIPSPRAVDSTRSPIETSLATRAPATTRLLFRISDVNTAFAHGTGDTPLRILAAACEVTLGRGISSVEGWITERGDAHVEIAGEIRVGDASCLLRRAGAMSKVDADDRKALFDLSPREGGGVVLTSPRSRAEPPGAPRELLSRFERARAPGEPAPEEQRLPRFGRSVRSFVAL